MLAASDEFTAAVVGGYELVEIAQFTFPEGSPGPTFESVVAGDFSIDASAAIRHNASMRMVSDTATPAEIRDALSVKGVEVQYSRGMRLSNGLPETYPMFKAEMATGTLKLSRAGIEPVPVTLYDSFGRLQWGSAQAFSVPPGTNYVEAMKQIINRFAPSVRWADVMSTEFITPALAYGRGTDVAGVVAEMAKSIGAEIFFDAYNALNIAPIPLTFGRPTAWTFNCDEPGSGVIDIQVETNFDRMPNGVIITGQHSSGATVTGEAWDDNPTSPTFRGGGERAIQRTTEKTLTAAQCKVMARGMLEKLLGGAFEIVMSIVPNPLFVLGDLVQINSERLGLADAFVVQAISGDVGRDNVGSPMVLRLRRGVKPSDLEI